MTIPASNIVNVLPGVVGTGGNPLSLNGVFLTEKTEVPIGTVMAFSSQLAVANFFGASSLRAQLATNYFLGFDTSTAKPSTMYFAQYPLAPVTAYLRGGVISGLSLTALQGLSGSLTVTIDGTVKTASSVNLSAATSFSSAATIIGTALSAAVTYDSQRGAFVITGVVTGATGGSITYATGTIAAGLLLTQATGAVLSQGADVGNPLTFMDGVKAITQNWANFTTVFEPVLADKLSFAQWTNGQNKRFCYVPWDTDVAATQSGITTSFGYQAKLLNYNSCCPVYNTPNLAAFVLGAAASINFSAVNGRITFAFKTQSGFVPTVTDLQTATNLEANGYNFYGSYATANQTFNFFYPGQISGDFKWMDSYQNEIYLNAQFQLALMSLEVGVNSVPYNVAGRALIKQAAQDPINQMLNFGGIQTGVNLSALQIAAVNTQAGLKIDDTLTNLGYYFQVLQATAQVRGLRGSPPCNFWYTDGGSVQRITLASIDVL